MTNTPPSTMTTMSNVERQHFEHVAATCWEDAQYCQEEPTMLMPSSILTPFAEAFDMASVVDSMIQAMNQELPLITNPEPLVQAEERALESPSAPSGPLVIIHHSSSSSISRSNPCQEDVMIQQIITHFLPVMADEHVLAQEMNAHGQQMLMVQEQPAETAAEDTHEHRLARRLSEVTPEEIHEHRTNLFLPFSADKSRCLYRAFQERRVSEPCGVALDALGQVRMAQFNLRQAQHVREMNAYTHLTTMYCFIFCTALVLFCRRHKQMPMTFRHVHEVRRMRTTRLATVIGFSGMSILCLMGFLPPHVLLQACVVFSAYIFIRAVLAACFTDAVDDCCSGCCCCCGSTPEDAANGNLTELQMCCDCCGGTGQCCGDSGCCACCSGTTTEKAMMGYKLITTVECCSCACCADGCCGGGCCDGCCCGTAAPSVKQSDVKCCSCACCADGCCGGGCCDGCCCGAAAPPVKQTKVECCSCACCADGCCGGGCCDGCCCGTTAPPAKQADVKCCSCACCADGCCGGGCCDGCCCGTTAPPVKQTKVECCSCACCADGCCGGGCCEGCCGMTNKKKKILPIRHEIYEGVPVQIV